MNRDVQIVNKHLPVIFERAMKYEMYQHKSLEWEEHDGRRCVDGTLDMRCRDNKVMTKRRPEMILEPLKGPTCKEIMDIHKAKMIEFETKVNILTSNTQKSIEPQPERPKYLGGFALKDKECSDKVVKAIENGPDPELKDKKPQESDESIKEAN